MSKHEVEGLYLFENATAAGNSYKRTFQYYLMSTLRDNPSNTTLQQDGALPHYSTESKAASTRNFK